MGTGTGAGAGVGAGLAVMMVGTTDFFAAFLIPDLTGLAGFLLVLPSSLLLDGSSILDFCFPPLILSFMAPAAIVALPSEAVLSAFSLTRLAGFFDLALSSTVAPEFYSSSMGSSLAS